MARVTNKIEKGAKSIGAGLKMVGGANVSSFEIKFLTHTQSHGVGSHQTVVVPYAEIGRDSSCVISFDQSLQMVSRKHAAIERRGQEVYLIQLSETNQTLINGRPIHKEWPLRNGDEIQLSATGPRLKFLTGTANTTSIGLSKRIQLFAKQSLWPYRVALLGLFLLMAAGAAFAIYWLNNLQTENQQLQQAYQQIDAQTKKQEEALKNGDSIFLDMQKQTAEKLAAVNQEKLALSQELKNVKKDIEKLRKTPPPAVKASPELVPQATIAAKADLPSMLEQVKKHVYFLRMYLTIEGELDHAFVGSGTGFLLSDGRFVTARHCIEPWAYASLEKNKQSDEEWLIINWLYHNSPKKTVRLDLEIVSPENKITYVAADKFNSNSQKDLFYNDIDVGYGAGKIQLASPEDGNDWAYYTINAADIAGIKSDAEAANYLKSGTVLHVLGYTYGIETAKDAPSPFYSTANVSQNGLVQGLINVTNLGFAEGNSGGPVFIEKDGQLVNVGLVSGARSVLGIVVPISALQQ